MSAPRIIRDLRLPLAHTAQDIAEAVAQSAGRPSDSMAAGDFRIIRQSIDARHPKAISWLYSVELDPAPQSLAGVSGLITAVRRPAGREHPVVVGAGRIIRSALSGLSRQAAAGP